MLWQEGVCRGLVARGEASLTTFEARQAHVELPCVEAAQAQVIPERWRVQACRNRSLGVRGAQQSPGPHPTAGLLEPLHTHNPAHNKPFKILQPALTSHAIVPWRRDRSA